MNSRPRWLSHFVHDLVVCLTGITLELAVEFRFHCSICFFFLSKKQAIFLSTYIKRLPL